MDECKAIYDTYNQSDKVLYFCMQRMYDEKGKLTVNNIIQDAVLGKAETFQQCSLTCHNSKVK